MRQRLAIIVMVAVAVTISAALVFANSGYSGNSDLSRPELGFFSSPNHVLDNKPAEGHEGTRESLPVSGYVTISVVRDNSEIYHYDDHNLITDAGRDFISAQIGSTSGTSNGANYIALSSDATAPASSDTSLAGELSGNGLDRTQGTYSHALGTNTFSAVNVFNATGTVNGIQKAGLFTAASGGTMLAENTFSAVNLISGDQLTITWTITIG